MKPDEIVFEDSLAPTRALSAEDRAWLRRRTAPWLERAQRELLALLGLDEDANWRTETGRDERGFLPDEWNRFEIWRSNKRDVVAAREAWTWATRATFVRHLIAQRRLSEEVGSRG